MAVVSRHIEIYVKKKLSRELWRYRSTISVNASYVEGAVLNADEPVYAQRGSLIRRMWRDAYTKGNAAGYSATMR